jgi:hypothetical protein
LTPAPERLTPKAWIQRYLGVDFPGSAKHFVLYYRSGDEDVVLLSFDITKDDLGPLLDGRSIFPSYGDLARRGSGLPEWIVPDSGSQYFAQKVAAWPNALSAARRRTSPAKPLEVRLWANETSVGTWEVCVSILTDRQINKASVSGAFEIPAAPQGIRSYVTIDGRPGQPYDTRVWQRWNLDEAGYREFMQTVETRADVGKHRRVGGERLADRLDARGPSPEVSWWKPAELKQSRAGDSEPMGAFWYKGSGMASALVVGHVDGLFRCYAFTERNVLVPDPLDAIRGLLGLPLPVSAYDTHYESASNMAGVVYWIRFDLPPRDFVTCLAQTPILPTYAEFAADATVREYLQTAYQTGSPEWWRPGELNQGMYALRRSNAKDLSDVSVGLGHLPGENIRVYIGGFSPW